MKSTHKLLVTSLLAFVPLASAAAHIVTANVQRTGPDQLTVRWDDTDAVDIYASTQADFLPQSATLLAHDSRTGAYVFDHASTTRRYFMIIDHRDRQRLEVAERLVPLAQGSNFRDIGGYPAANGKHVRWGMIFRSGATPLLTADDLQELKGLGLRTMVDLRSSEERQLAPTRVQDVTYITHSYSIQNMMTQAAHAATQKGTSGGGFYAGLPAGLAPQLRILFASLLRKDVPLVYNCTAGQDRTGFTTAMILSALSVPREVIFEDYLLSTRYRRPQFEIPTIDAATQSSNPLAKFFAENAKNAPQPLIDSDGKPLLIGAFTEIDSRWGSVNAYLQQEIGLAPADIERLRVIYLQ